ncbi:MAG: orotate phosphoribosyltransferase [Planctomycetota bacterium]|nr:MAG: orotate phosphoribosyltransferase [Planctomycetota bacterium]REJ95070.1 MAG: orotate phosphoribosyltransferase [Planctomycetota bacterium]REK25866.1 MAG: orotate phosphoribosyltransferase [Planctomycetota bacterium]REK37145.1 MAG: orotate phosphoribosyltransferase [Planctomycetota bacterium]
MSNKQQLIDLFRERALRFGEFTLASGKKSTYYVDKMQITLHAAGLRLACEGLLDLIAGIDCDAVGGMTIGADPIVGGMLTLAAEKGRDLEGFLVRKEPKGHGTQQFIEGPLQAGQRVVIVEDVVTTGGSSIKAIDRVRDFGANVVQVVAIVDRLEGGAANFAAHDVPFKSLLTIEDFGISPPKP